MSRDAQELIYDETKTISEIQARFVGEANSSDRAILLPNKSVPELTPTILIASVNFDSVSREVRLLRNKGLDSSDSEISRGIDEFIKQSSIVSKSDSVAPVISGDSLRFFDSTNGVWWSFPKKYRNVHGFVSEVFLEWMVGRISDDLELLPGIQVHIGTYA